MFRYLILRLRVAKVQAELMAQVKNQEAVNNICQNAHSVEFIDLLYRKAYYRKRKDADFLIVCALMVMVINDLTFTEMEREFCYNVLKERFNRMKNDNGYCVANFMVVGDCEEAMLKWEKSKAREHCPS